MDAIGRVPIETISQMLGHTNVKTTQIYAEISDTVIERDMNAFAQKLNKVALFVAKDR